jgi:hypothetical protein
MAARLIKALGLAGVWSETRRKFSTTTFQAEVYAIKTCPVENLDRNYRNRNIYILSDSEVATKTLDNYQNN